MYPTIQAATDSRQFPADFAPIHDGFTHRDGFATGSHKFAGVCAGCNTVTLPDAHGFL
jgi:hypothetical protein